MKIDANDVAAKHGLATLKSRLLSLSAAAGPEDSPPRGIVDMATVMASPPPRPHELIRGICFQGSKLYMQAPSKGRKTFMQQHLGLCVATGQPWFGHPVTQGAVLYVNFELGEWSFFDRICAIANRMRVELSPGQMRVLHCRGQKMSVERLEIELEACRGDGYKLIIFDPLYKMLGARSENDAGEMGDLLNRIEAIGHQTGAAVLVAHHFAKGNAAAKSAIDRGSGSGVIGRDGDMIMTMTPHSVPDCFVMEMILRDFSPVAPVGLRWSYPMFKVDPSLCVDDLEQPKKPGRRNGAECQNTTSPDCPD